MSKDKSYFIFGSGFLFGDFYFATKEKVTTGGPRGPPLVRAVRAKALAAFFIPKEIIN